MRKHVVYPVLVGVILALCLGRAGLSWLSGGHKHATHDTDLMSTATTSSATRNTTGNNPWLCRDPPYTVRIFSFFPLVIYIENFLTKAERTHLLDLAYMKP